MKLKTTILLLSLIVLQVSLSAQEKCLTGLNLQELTRQDPLLAAGINTLDNYIQAQMPDALAKVNSGQMDLIRIPVVVHIVYNPSSPEENISDDVVKTQIRILNDNFRRVPGTQGYNSNPDGRDAMIEFYLAETDPDGKPSTGITRTASSKSPFYWKVNGGKDVTAAKYSSFGGRDAWDTGKYLNIWVCDLLYNSGVTYGYAQMPLYTGTPGEVYLKASDGVVIDCKAFGNAGSKNYPGVDRARTTTHQVGHWLGLRHTQEDKNFMISGDGTYVTKSNNKLTANYMDSNLDANTNSFTVEQIAVMRIVLEGPRNSLLFRGIKVNVDQRLSDNSTAGSIGVWDGNSFVQNNNLPASLIFKKGAPVVLKSDQSIINNQKFQKWAGLKGTDDRQIISPDNPADAAFTSQFAPVFDGVTVRNSLEGTELTGGQIGFKDPWLIDYPDPAFGNTMRNQGMDAPIKQKTSPFVPSFSAPNNGDLHQGVFLNMTVSSGSYYSIKAPSEENILLNGDGKYHRFYFQNWSGTAAAFGSPQSPETPVTFTDGAAMANAVLKGTHLSDDIKAFEGSGQRKILRTPDGYIHMVYSSMGKVWYELSKDNGRNWILMNGGKPVDAGASKLPSMDYYGNSVAIAWQSMDQTGASTIKLQVFYNASGDYAAGAAGSIAAREPFSTDIFPTIAWGSEGRAVILWETKGINGNLSYKYGQLSSTQISWISEGAIPGSDSTATCAAVSSAKDASSLNYFNLAWQQGDMPYAMIYYIKLHFTDSGSLDENSLPFYLSIYANFNTNVSPSIISLPGGGARMAWKGYNEIGSDWGEYYVVAADPDNPWYMHYLNKYAGQVYSPQINEGTGGYVIGWSEPNGNKYDAVCTDSYTLSTMKTVSGSDGRAIQIINGGTRDEMFITGFRSENGNAPYSFIQSEPIGAITANKTSQPLSGRTVGLVKEKAQFYLTLGNIKSDGVNIKFAGVKDKKVTQEQAKLNSNFETEPFMVRNNSAFTFTVRCGLKDSLAAFNALKDGRYVSFKVELVEDGTDNVLGNCFDAKLDRQNLIRSREYVYNISTKGLGSKLVRLRIVPDENIQAEYFIADRTSGKETALSQSATSISGSYTGSAVVKEYALSQNFPNPFNPSTVINYDIPKPSKVTLKVYDVLGKEVAALVDGYKEMGSYSVQFNASHLPSGTYIYELRADGFIRSGKMMLLK